MDITTKRDLEEVLKLEKDFYVEKSLSGYFEQLATSDLKLKIWDFQKHLRKAEYHYNNRKKSLYHKIMYIYHRRKKNVRGGYLEYLYGRIHLTKDYKFIIQVVQ